MTSAGKRTVLVVERRLTHYRVPFFEALRIELAARACDLLLAHGGPTDIERTKSDEGELPWAHSLPTRYWLGGRVCWQPFGMLARRAELVVVNAENKLLSNLPMQLLDRRRRVALWGHGAGLDADPESLRERFKRYAANRADWWFAYTSVSVPLIERSGFPRDRITLLNNAVDTAAMQELVNRVDVDRIDRLRESLGLRGQRVGAFIGSLYELKGLPFLLEAAAAIRQRVPDFELLIVGSGPQQSLVQAFCAQHPWAKALGVRTGQDKFDVLGLSHVMLNPHGLGLGILDSFVSGVPVVTTDSGKHGPEAAYLENGRNGVMSAPRLDEFVAAASRLLEDPAALKRLRDGCRASASKYTVGHMAENFADGVEAALAAPIRRFR